MRLKLPETSKIGECYECGVCTSTCPLAHMIPWHYNPRTTMLRLFLDPEKTIMSIAPWLCMRCRRCSKQCPQRMSPHELFFQVRTAAVNSGYIQDPLQQIYEVISLLEEKIPLPLISSWLCLRPDEVHETSSRMSEAVDEALGSFVERHVKSLHSNPVEGSKKVAVAGSGPAGLAAASELARRGYSVSILEISSSLGGMLRHGIPNFRLSRDIVDAEVQHLLNLGVDVETNICLGKDTTIQNLFDAGNRAVFLASGCSVPMTLPVDGNRLDGVIYAIDFLKTVNGGRQIKLGNSVAVIGGGNVGIDAARTAVRMKAPEVRLLCPESREEMPSDLTDILRAEREGIQIQPSCIPMKIIGKEGKVTSIQCLKARPGQYDRDGRFLLIPIKGTEFDVEADTVIVAIGQQVELDSLPAEIRVTEQNTVGTDPFTLETSMDGVFAGGDITSGPASVFEAIYAGWKGAISMDHYIRCGTAGPI